MLTRNLPVRSIVRFSIGPIGLAMLWSGAIVSGFSFLGLRWLAIPFLPISLLGVAVSFYLGFKNSAANERQNDARQGWGSITNDSRALVAMLGTYLPAGTPESQAARRTMLKRHISWLYAHKSFLLGRRMAWEHRLPVNETYRELFRKNFSINLDLEKDLARYLSTDELQDVLSAPNAASRLLQNQSAALRQLRSQELIEDFRLFELQNHITVLYQHQGRNERIKTFPIPWQYASYSRLFVNLFIFLLPLGLLRETQDVNAWLTVPFSTLISWVFYQMELVGEYSEHPFEGLIGDVPITSITRNIEIEILHSLGETDLPQPIVPVEGVLM